MAGKTKETISIERYLWGLAHKQGTFRCLEVTIGINGTERVDFLTWDTKGAWKAYEIKVTKSDFHSKCANSFVGNYNYYAMPAALYEQVQDEIPAHIGVVCDGCGVVKHAHRVETSVPHDVLMTSLMRSMCRSHEEYQRAIFENTDPADYHRQKERKANRITISRLRMEVRGLRENLNVYRGTLPEHGKRNTSDYWRARAWKAEEALRDASREARKLLKGG